MYISNTIYCCHLLLFISSSSASLSPPPPENVLLYSFPASPSSSSSSSSSSSQPRPLLVVEATALLIVSVTIPEAFSSTGVVGNILLEQQGLLKVRPEASDYRRVVPRYAESDLGNRLLPLLLQLHVPPRGPLQLGFLLC